jgi:hypothetical protein
MGVFSVASSTISRDDIITTAAIGTLSFYDPVNQFLVTANGTSLAFYRINLDTHTGNLPSANITFAALGNTAISIRFFYDGTWAYLVSGSDDSTGCRFWRFDPLSTGTNVAATATFTYNRGNWIDFVPNGVDSFVIVGSTLGGGTTNVYKLNPVTISSAINTPTFTIGGSNFANEFACSMLNASTVIVCRANTGNSALSYRSFNVSNTTNLSFTFVLSLPAPACTRLSITVSSSTVVYGLINHPNANQIVFTRFDPTTGASTNTILPTGSNPLTAAMALSSGTLYAVSADNSTSRSATLYSFNPATISNVSQAQLVSFGFDLPVTFVSPVISNSRLILLAITTSLAIYRSTLRNRVVTATNTNANNRALTQTTSGVLTLSASLSAQDFNEILRSGSSQNTLGFGTEIYPFSATFSSPSSWVLSNSLVLSAGATITDSNFTGVIASGSTLTLGSTTPYDLPITIASGATLTLTQNTIITSRFILSASATVNGPFALTVPYADPGVTLTGGATLITPTASVIAANFADGVRAQISHRQVFTIASTAINTSTDVLTLGNDSNGDAANFRTSSPNTLVRFSLSSGATIPTSSPQIIDGGLYYWRTGGQLSITEGGTAINFSSQGSGNFILIAETEINNAVVSGGSGYSFALTRANNAQIRVKAAHWSELSGNASSSKFYDQVFAWSSTAGISILDTVNNAVAASQEAIHEQIVAITSLPLEGLIKDATGAIITSISPANSGAAVTGLALALEGVGKIQMNATDVDGILAWLDLYLWGCYVRATEAGIRLASATTFAASNIFNYVMTNLEFTNPTSTPLAIVGGVGTSSDGSSLVSSTTTGSIILNALSQGTGAIVSVSGGGGATPADIWGYSGGRTITGMSAGAITAAAIATDAIDADAIAADAITEIQGTIPANVTAIKAKTDQLVFTTANRVDSTAIGVPTNPLLTNDSRLNNLDATVSSRMATFVYTAPDNTAITAIKTQTDKFVFTTANRVDSTAIGVPTNPLLTGDTRLNNLDAAVSTRPTLAQMEASTVLFKTSNYTAPPTVNQIWTGFTSGTVATNLVTQFQSGLFQSTSYTAPNNAGILSAIAALPQDKLNYSLTDGAITDAKIAANAITAAKISADVTTEIQSGLATSGALSAAQAAINAIPTNPLLTGDARLNNLDAAISTRPTLTQMETSTVLFKTSNYTAPDNTTIANIGTRTTRMDALLTNPGGGDRFTTTALSNTPSSPAPTAAEIWQNSDRTLTTAGNTAIATSVWSFIVGTISTVGSAARLLNRLAKIHGLTNVSVSASDTGRTTSDGDVNQTITTNVDGSKTMSGDE